MEKQKGYRWFIEVGCEEYEPEECTYPTLEATETAMKEYLKGSKIPLSACGIDLVEEDEDGCIEVLEQVVKPTETYYEN